jgi:hypothetical protein
VKNRFIFILLFFPLLLAGKPASSADFSDWEGSGAVLIRFGEEHPLKNAREWTQWAEERLLKEYYRFNGFSTEEKIHLAALSAWEKAVKEESRSYSTARFPTDRWKGYEYLSLTYTNLDFKEQAFGIHFEMVPGTLKLDQILRRYGNGKAEVIDEGKEKRYRFTLSPGASLKGTPLEDLQEGMIENDELWLDFGVREGEDIRFVEVLTVKAKPDRVPFTKNWKWDD